MIEKKEYLKAKKIVDEYENQLNIHNVIASDFLTKRKISLTNSLTAMFRQNPDMCEIGGYFKYEKAIQYGYDLAIRRLKNNAL
jgi:hypothetical protein